MSRHSKNCTASSVFTYAEKRKLMDYGTVTTRIGTDSQRAFNMCHLCLSTAEQPMSCLSGHLFCKNCVVEFLVNQKREHQLALENWLAAKREFDRKKENDEDNEKQRIIDSFEMMEHSKAKDPSFYTTLQKSQLNSEELNEQTIQQMVDFKAGKVSISKEEAKKLNFWLPENQIMTPDKLGPKPSNAIKCPADLSHGVKFKELVNLKVISSENAYLCHSCKKELKFQRVLFSRICGHVMCRTCFLQISTKECGICSQAFQESDVVELKRGGTGYSSHNEVEAKKYNPIFN